MSTTQTKKPGLTPIVKAYTECALWASTDDDDEPLDNGERELSDAARAQFEADCAAFMDYCAEAIGNDWHAGQTFEQIGHDFWLTRNRHGAGFWDRGLGELGSKLTDAAHTFGSCDLYIGDDGLVYAS